MRERRDVPAGREAALRRPLHLRLHHRIQGQQGFQSGQLEVLRFRDWNRFRNQIFSNFQKLLIPIPIPAKFSIFVLYRNRFRVQWAIHQSAFVSFRPNGPMGASYLILWANGLFSFRQNEMNADWWIAYWIRFRVLESIPKSDIYHGYGSDSNSDSSKKRNHNASSPSRVTLMSWVIFFTQVTFSD